MSAILSEGALKTALIPLLQDAVSAVLPDIVRVVTTTVESVVGKLLRKIGRPRKNATAAQISHEQQEPSEKMQTQYGIHRHP